MPRRVRSRRDDVVIHRVGLRADAVDWVDEMLVTVPTRMVGDLAAQSMDGEHLAGIVADLLHRHLADRDALASELARYADRYGGPPGNGYQFLDYLLSFAPGTTS